MNYRVILNKQKRACDVALAAMLLLIYFILGAIKVTPPRHVIKHHYKEIDWALFNSQKVESSSKKNIFPSPVSGHDDYSEIENRIMANLDFLENEANNQLNIARKNYGELQVPIIDDGSNNKINVINDDNVAKLPALINNNKKSNFLRDYFPNPQSYDVPSIRIDNAQNLIVDISSNRTQGANRFREIPKEKAIPEAEVIKIKLRPEELKKEDKDISPIVSELIIWMKKNRTSFSSILKRFMNFEEGNLTSKVKFKINNKIYELYILCKENVLEVRICLVEKENLILLIDNGFKERSNYLREGAVMRKPQNGEISTFITQQKTPSAKSTMEFYKIFLSWWDTIKKDITSGANKK